MIFDIFTLITLSIITLIFFYKKKRREGEGQRYISQTIDSMSVHCSIPLIGTWKWKQDSLLCLR